MAVWSSVEIEDLSEDFRLDAEHYQPEYLQQEKAMAKLPHVELGKVASVSDGNHLSIAEDFAEEGVRYLRGQDLSDFFIADADPIYIPERTYKTLTRSHMFAGDVLVGIVGTIGSVGLVTKRHGKLTGNCKLAIVRAREMPAEYLAAYLASRIGQNEIQRRVRGAVQMGLILPDIKKLPVVIPSDAQRKAVVLAVRGAERNRERCRELVADAEGLLMASIGLAHLDPNESLFYERDFSELNAARRFDAEYFSPRFQRALEILARNRTCLCDIADLTERRFRPGKPKRSDTFQYIEIGSMRGDGLVDSETVEVSEAPSRAHWKVESGDIITSTVRPIRRLSALITPNQSGHVCSSGFAVLRPKEGAIEPEVLLTYLRLPIICELLDLHTTASMYPAISTARLMQIPIAVPNPSIRKEIVGKVREALTARAEAAGLLEEVKAEVESLVLGSGK